MNEQLQAIVTVLSLVNPAICGAMFAQATGGETLGGKLADATKASAAILVILAGAALVGIQLLHVFGVSLDAFMVAGGGVLSWMGFSMLAGESAAADSKATTSLTPLILCGESGDHHRRHHALCGPHAAEVAGHFTGRHRGGERGHGG